MFLMHIYFNSSDGKSLLSVDFGGSRNGDVASLRHRNFRLSEPACLHIEYYLEGQVQLDITTKSEPHTDTKQHICSLSPGTGNH